ncbi:MAG TPA: glycosyltransferase [Ignavibacteria bacterium]|nr:glycosyltransferase [Ignavibacteria bacterium]
MISIILTSFNRKNLLKKSLESILNQSYRDIEVIIIDNNSTDGTEEELSTYRDPRINFFNVGSVNNLGKSRNIGISKAKGDLIAFCDDDDIWYPDKLEFQLKYVHITGVVCTDVDYVDKDNVIIKKSIFPDKISDLIFSKATLLYQNLIMVTSVLIDKEILLKAGQFDSLRYCEDYDLWMRVTDFTKIIFLNKISMAVMVHANSLSRINQNAIDMRYIIIKHQLKYIKSPDKELKIASKAGLVKSRYQLFRLLISNKRYFDSLKELFRLIPFISDINVAKFFIKVLFFKENFLLKKLN